MYTIKKGLKDTLAEVVSTLSKIDKKLDRILKAQTKLLQSSAARKLTRDPRGDGELPMDAVTLLGIPDHLRETAMVLARLGEGTAAEVATETSQTREAESAKLNQLYRMTILNRRRNGHRIIFSPA